MKADQVGIEIETEFPVVWDWMNRIRERPAIKKVLEEAGISTGETVTKD